MPTSLRMPLILVFGPVLAWLAIAEMPASVHVTQKWFLWVFAIALVCESMAYLRLRRIYADPQQTKVHGAAKAAAAAAVIFAFFSFCGFVSFNMAAMNW